MMKFEIEAHINRSPEAVWDTLINPKKIALYMFGSEAESNWHEGDELKFFLNMEGKRVLIVNGTITETIKEKVLEHTLFPSNWEMEDIPSNYINVRYELEASGENGTLLKITQAGFENAAQGEKRYEDVKNGWPAVLQSLKEVAEAS